MRPPRSKFGDFVITYKQVPYEDRYFYISYRTWTQMAKIPLRIYNELGRKMFWFVPEQKEPQLERFLAKVYDYNQYLDSTDA